MSTRDEVMDTLTLDQIELKQGAHGAEFCGEACAVEVANLIAARRVIAPPELLRCTIPLEPAPFGDDHPSISRVIRNCVIGLNDAWPDEQRQRLKPYAAKILCTATGDEDEETRAWMVTDWLVRVHAPAWLRLAGLEGEARALEGLARISDATLARAAQPTIDEVRRKSAAAPAAAWDAAPAAASAAARAAAWDAARAAAYSKALEAGEVALAPTVEALQMSALALLDDMIAVSQSLTGSKEP